LKYGPFGMSYV